MIEDIKKIKRQLRDRLNKCSDIPTLRNVASAIGYRPPGWPYSVPLLPIPTRGKMYPIGEFRKEMLLLIRKEIGRAYFACPMWMSNIEVNIAWVYSDSYEELPKGFTHIVWFKEEDTHV